MQVIKIKNQIVRCCPENSGANSKQQDVKMNGVQMTDQTAGRETAGHKMYRTSQAYL